MTSFKKLTITQLHNDRLKEIYEEEKKIPELKIKIDELEESSRKSDDIAFKKNCELEVKKLKKNIDEIQSLRMDYYKNSGYLLSKHIEKNKKSHTKKVGLESLGKKEFKKNSSVIKGLYRNYRSSVDPDYVCVDEDTVNDENYCFNCKKFKVTTYDESIMVCPKCGSQSIITQKYTRPITSDTQVDCKSYEYQRFTHFCDWIDKIQGKEKQVIPDYIIEAVNREIRREFKTDKLETLTEKDIKRYLKKYKNKGKKKYDIYYVNSTKILWLVTNIQPLQMTAEMESNLQSMFMAIQEPYELYKEDKHNISGYSYILSKFCQLLGYYEFLPKFNLHKNEALTYKHDMIWKKICKYMGGEEKGWKFIKSYYY
jgi:ribosomal protein L37AE/L43A